LVPLPLLWLRISRIAHHALIPVLRWFTFWDFGSFALHVYALRLVGCQLRAPATLRLRFAVWLDCVPRSPCRLPLYVVAGCAVTVTAVTRTDLRAFTRGCLYVAGPVRYCGCGLRLIYPLRYVCPVTYTTIYCCLTVARLRLLCLRFNVWFGLVTLCRIFRGYVCLRLPTVAFTCGRLR